MEDKNIENEIKIVPLISDDEIKKWEDFLRKNNFLEDEIRDFLSHLNEKYYKKMKVREKNIDEKIKKLEEKITKKSGHDLSEEEKKFLRELAEDKEDFI